MFLACCFVSFAVWPWDNTKIMLWAWLAVAPCLWIDFLRPLPCLARCVVCFALFFTGAVSLVAGLDKRHDYSLAEIPPLHDTARAVRDIPAEARFACAPEYWHPLIMLGRKVAMGYDGHLWSHGITYNGKNSEKVAAFQNLMMGAPSWQDDAKKLGIDYIYWGAPENDVKRYQLSRKPWEASLPVAARGENFVIYALPAR